MKLLGESTVALAEGKSADVRLPEKVRVRITNVRESGTRCTVRVQSRGWGGAVTYTLEKNHPALLVGPVRGRGRLILAVKPR